MQIVERPEGPASGVSKSFKSDNPLRITPKSKVKLKKMLMEQALKIYFIHPQEFSSFIETYI